MDKNAAKRARAAVKRINVRLAKIRDQARAGKARLEHAVADDRVKAKIASIKAGLDAQNAAAHAAIDGKVQTAIERLAASKRVQLVRAEIARTKKRARLAQARISAAEKAHEAARRARERIAAKKAGAKPKRRRKATRKS